MVRLFQPRKLQLLLTPFSTTQLPLLIPLSTWSLLSWTLLILIALLCAAR